jgi:hypothetical protein
MNGGDAEDSDTFYEHTSEGEWLPRKTVIDETRLLRTLAARPRPVTYGSVFDPEMWKLSFKHELFEEHFPHVDINKPALMGLWTAESELTGERRQFHVLVGGHHRCAARLIYRLRPLWFQMTEEETRACAFPTTTAYMRSKGVYLVTDLSDEEVDRMMDEKVDAFKREIGVA